MSDKPNDQPPTSTPPPRPTGTPTAGAAAVSELIKQHALAELVEQLLTACTSRYAVSLVQGGTTVTVHTTSFPVLQHLTGYLHYATGQAGWGTSRWQVTATVAPLPPLPSLPETLTGEYGEPATMAEIHPAGRLVHLKRTGSLLAIDPITQRLAICNPEPRGLFVDTYKAVRQLLTSASLTAGMTVLHASALTIAGQAVVITGPRGAGKSTLLAALLAETGRVGALLGNDRILLDPTGEVGVTVHGWPTVTGLGYGTLTALPSLTSRLSRRLHGQAGGTASWLLDQPLLPERAAEVIPAEVTADPTGPRARTEKVWLTPQELVVATGSTTGAAGRLALLVAPTVDPQEQTSGATRLLPAEAAKLVRANLHQEAWRDHPNWLGLIWPTSDARGVLRRLLDSPGTSAVSLRVGRDPITAARVVLEVLTGGPWPPPQGQDDA